MTSFRARSLRVAQSSAQGVAIALLWIGSLATPVLAVAAWLGAQAREAAAREWNPRLWDRDHDDRAENEERRP